MLVTTFVDVCHYSVAKKHNLQIKLKNIDDSGMVESVQEKNILFFLQSHGLRLDIKPKDNFFIFLVESSPS